MVEKGQVSLCGQSRQRSVASAGLFSGLKKVKSPTEERVSHFEAANHSLEQIEVVAALLENHRRGLVRIPPIAAVEGVAIVPIADFLDAFDGDDASDFLRVQELFEFQYGGSVTEDMTDENDGFLRVSGVHQAIELFGFAGNRLLQKDVVAEFDGLKGVADVVLVLGRDDDDVAPSLLEEFVIVKEAPFFRDVKDRPVFVELRLVEVTKRDHLELLWEAGHGLAVDVGAAMPGA